jgi:endonuclease YncB( thermonuclease family)
MAGYPCPASVRGELRCVPLSDLKAHTFEGMGRSHRRVPGAGPGIGGISNAVSRHAEPTSGKGPSSASHGAGKTDPDIAVKVTRVVDGDTIDISPSVEGRSRVRLIGMDTPEVYFGTRPYGPEASAFAKREVEGEEVGLRWPNQ